VKGAVNWTAVIQNRLQQSALFMVIIKLAVFNSVTILDLMKN
jgi:hypothetical protein